MKKGTSTNPALKLLLERASCRNFSDRPVPPEVLDQVLAAGVHGPTGGNLQPYSIIKVQEAITRHRLCELCGDQPFIAKAPVNLLFCIDWHRSRRWAELEVAPFTAADSFRMFWISFQDTVICAHGVATAADSVGLGSVYVGLVLECFLELRELFGLPDGVLPVVLLCVGYPKGVPEPARKLGPEAIVHEETYGELDDDALRKAFGQKHQGKTRKITDERLEQIARVAREVHGSEFAIRCVERIEQNDCITPAQAYFGLQYPADRMAEDNDVFLAQMEELGFGWFKRYVPPGQEGG